MKRTRSDLTRLDELIAETGGAESEREFIEGLFDAEGCVNIIREETRKTSKVCIDFTNTDFELLMAARRSIKKVLDVEARLSVQIPRTKNRKSSYHLRIYRRESIQPFLDRLHTTKLVLGKRHAVSEWLEKGETGKSLTLGLPQS